MLSLTVLESIKYRKSIIYFWHLCLSIWSEAIGATRDAVDTVATKLSDIKLRDHLLRAAGATYDAAPESDETDQFCLQGTRVALLERIHNWAISEDDKQLFWLNGAAGTGKVSQGFMTRISIQKY